MLLFLLILQILVNVEVDDDTDDDDKFMEFVGVFVLYRFVCFDVVGVRSRSFVVSSGGSCGGVDSCGDDFVRNLFSALVVRIFVGLLISNF